MERLPLLNLVMNIAVNRIASSLGNILCERPYFDLIFELFLPFEQSE